MKKKEQQIQKDILNALNRLGYYVFKINNVGIKKPDGHYIPAGRRGVSDILGLAPDGKFVAIEVKTPERRNNISIHQQDFLDRIREHGGIAFVACSAIEAINNINRYYAIKKMGAE